MRFYLVEVRLLNGVCNSWTSEKAPAVKLAKQLAKKNENVRVLQVDPHGKSEMTELLNMASGYVSIHLDLPVVWQAKSEHVAPGGRRDSMLPLADAAAEPG